MSRCRDVALRAAHLDALEESRVTQGLACAVAQGRAGLVAIAEGRGRVGGRAGPYALESGGLSESALGEGQGNEGYGEEHS